MQEITCQSHTMLLTKVQQILEKADYNDATVTIVKIKKDRDIT